MPYHTPPVERKLKKSVEKMIIAPKNKKKKIKVFETLPPNSHKMKGGKIMSGKVHSKNSKIIGKLKKKKM
jgi:hypothetical protein